MRQRERANESPTRLSHNLMSVFFSREELARFSCYGSRQNPALDKDILLACISELIRIMWLLYVIQREAQKYMHVAVYMMALMCYSSAALVYSELPIGSFLCKKFDTI